MSKEKKFVDLNSARVDDQRNVMQQIVQDGVCPFCMENFTRYHKKPILREGEHWILTENQWPYDHTKYHFLAVAKKHIETIESIPLGAMEELREHLQWAIKENSVPGGSFFMRFGDIKYTGSSVAHLHAQLLMGDVDAPGHESVRVKLG